MDLDFKILHQTFLTETEEHLCEMEEALVALESNPSDEAAFSAVFRYAHTIKGAASCVGLHTVSRFAHVVEDVLVAIREQTIPAGSDLISLLLQAVDALRHIAADGVAGSEEMVPAHRLLLRRLKQRLSNDVESGEPGDDLGPDQSVGRDHYVGAGRTRTLRIGVDRLDRMLDLTGELTIAKGRLKQRIEQLNPRDREDLLKAFEESDRFGLELQELVMKVRMMPVGPVFRPFVRTVRDLTRSSGKQVRLVIEGAEVEVDTSVVEHLKDPLNHMVRNAIDHGIETPEARKAAGKDPCGLLTLRASHDAGTMVIQLCDDGAGINRHKILDAARLRGVAVNRDSLSDQEVFQLIFESGFSTASGVTDLSGRGVGMDVVRRSIEALRGSVGIQSTEGQGTRVTMRLPLTLALIEGLAVGVGQETYVLAMASVVECLDVAGEELNRADICGVVSLRGEPLPCINLGKLFDAVSPQPTRGSIVVVTSEVGRAGLAVDALYGESQVVIKPLGRLFQGLPGVSGSTVLADGRVALILDVPGLMRDVLNREMTRQTVALS
jgi:two-component system chemotaxis sensor kinase CheA